MNNFENNKGIWGWSICFAKGWSFYSAERWSICSRFPTIEATRIQMTVEEAIILWPKIADFVKSMNREPKLTANDPLEVRMAQAIILLKEEKRRRG